MYVPILDAVWTEWIIIHKIVNCGERTYTPFNLRTGEMGTSFSHDTDAYKAIEARIELTSKDFKPTGDYKIGE